MTTFPTLVRSSSLSGETRYALGHDLVDRYLEFVAGRARPNTLRAVAFDLKIFFSVVDKEPTEVVAADVFDFLAHQRGDRTVIRISDRESGVSARTIARRLSSIAGLYAYLIARGDTSVRTNPVPRGLSTRREGGRSRTVPLVRVPRTLPRILGPDEANALLARSAPTGTGRWSSRCCWPGSAVAKCSVSGSPTSGSLIAPSLSPRARVATSGWCRRRTRSSQPSATTCATNAHRISRPIGVFVVLKGPRRGQPLSAYGIDEVMEGARDRAGLAHASCHELRHTCLTRLREAGMALEAVPGTGRAPLDRVDPDLPAPHERVAGRRVSAGGRPHRAEPRRTASRHRGDRPMTTAAATIDPWDPAPASHRDWAELSVCAPQLAATFRRYLIQLTTFLAPRSVDVADSTLRQFTRWLCDATEVRAVADLRRSHLESYKVWLSTQPGSKGPTMAKNTQRQRLRMIRICFERLIEWEWPDAPVRNPILSGDIPPRPEPLPRFLDDRDAARLLAAARS